MAIQLGTPKVIVESDSHVAINAITKQSQIPKFMRNLVKDIKRVVTVLGIFSLYSVMS